ncbi:MAG: hypothetical protein OHK0046_46450 [Anaerolineae bacterium]
MPLELHPEKFRPDQVEFDATQAAAYLGISRDTFYYHKRLGRIPARPHGQGKWWYHRDDLDKFYEDMKERSN